MQPSGLKTGILNIPLIKASLLIRGPFILSFEVPEGQAVPTPEQNIIADSTFEPLPVGEPCPWMIINILVTFSIPATC